MITNDWDTTELLRRGHEGKLGRATMEIFVEREVTRNNGYTPILRMIVEKWPQFYDQLKPEDWPEELRQPPPRPILSFHLSTPEEELELLKKNGLLEMRKEDALELILTKAHESRWPRLTLELGIKEIYKNEPLGRGAHLVLRTWADPMNFDSSSENTIAETVAPLQRVVRPGNLEGAWEWLLTAAHAFQWSRSRLETEVKEMFGSRRLGQGELLILRTWPEVYDINAAF